MEEHAKRAIRTIEASSHGLAFGGGWAGRFAKGFAQATRARPAKALGVVIAHGYFLSQTPAWSIREGA